MDRSPGQKAFFYLMVQEYQCRYSEDSAGCEMVTNLLAWHWQVESLDGLNPALSGWSVT
jgi:hypothetical protein